MTAEIVCECGNGCEMPHKHRDIASVSALPLDVERLCSIADSAIAAWRSDDPMKDHVIDSCIRQLQIAVSVVRLSESGSPTSEGVFTDEEVARMEREFPPPYVGESGSPTPMPSSVRRDLQRIADANEPTDEVDE